MNDWFLVMGKASPTGNGPMLQGNASIPTLVVPHLLTSAPRVATSAGGQVSFLAKIKQMKTYRGSQQWGDNGCWAMW
jgi:hypothetical protein